MPTTQLIATIARPAIRLGISASQVPFGIAERIAGERGNDEWPPALAFQELQATVLQASGSLLGDDQLAAQGHLLAEKVDRLRHAEELEAQAEIQRRQADEERDRKREAADRQRKEAAQAADQKRALAARRERDRKRKAEEQAAAAAERSAAAQAEAEKRTARQQRRGQTKAIATEREALAKEQAAAAAEQQAADLDAAIDASAAIRTRD